MKTYAVFLVPLYGSTEKGSPDMAKKTIIAYEKNSGNVLQISTARRVT
jgi:hypothetical protein